ncbi:SDR family NAD(P)-dependent oxidoreductase [Nonomuraea sp. NPDC050536]|uniref:SDR family NAD(P)-dependent oxidoreductase n=1 Tax=Nonomuraea sp. NPDC050536 TaxID=3364366 RepID=UPI0037CA2F32
MRLHGKVALITGAGTGIGAATAHRFAAEGAQVFLTGRRPGPLEEVALEIEKATAVNAGASWPVVATFAADMAVTGQARAAVAACLERFGRLDVLVANAGGHGGEAVADTGDESWQEALHANLNTCFVTCREALPALIDARGGIVIVSSIAGLAAGPAVSGYVTTKHALIGLTRSIARDYGPSGVRANCLCPGWVITPMADDQMDFLVERDGITREEAYALVTKDVPLRRPATPEEIAAICLFLASDESAIMTGSVVVADGGATAVDLPTLPFT